jgi:hypothetical protein
MNMGEKITIPPFTLQIWPNDNTHLRLVEVLPIGKNLAIKR